MFKLLPLDKFLALKYKKQHGRTLNLDNPQRLSEKIFWLKVYNGLYERELVEKLYDKYTARDYIKEKVGEEYLPKLYGIYDSADEIDFSKLPDKYVMKITQSCGYNYIKNEMSTLSDEEIRNTMAEWLEDINNLKNKAAQFYEESYYYTGKARIMCEEYLEFNGAPVVDRDIICINGEPSLYEVIYDFIGEHNEINHDARKNIYDVNGNFIPVEIGKKNDPSREIEKPDNFAHMLELAKKLCQDFPYIRVDQYNVGGRIVCGELTFIPLGCSTPINPEEMDYKLGELLQLPNVKLDYKKLKEYIVGKYM